METVLYVRSLGSRNQASSMTPNICWWVGIAELQGHTSILTQIIGSFVMTVQLSTSAERYSLCM